MGCSDSNPEDLFKKKETVFETVLNEKLGYQHTTRECFKLSFKNNDTVVHRYSRSEYKGKGCESYMKTLTGTYNLEQIEKSTYARCKFDNYKFETKKKNDDENQPNSFNGLGTWKIKGKTATRVDSLSNELIIGTKNDIITTADSMKLDETEPPPKKLDFNSSDSEIPDY